MLKNADICMTIIMYLIYDFKCFYYYYFNGHKTFFITININKWNAMEWNVYTREWNDIKISGTNITRLKIIFHRLNFRFWVNWSKYWFYADFFA